MSTAIHNNPGTHLELAGAWRGGAPSLFARLPFFEAPTPVPPVAVASKARAARLMSDAAAASGSASWGVAVPIHAVLDHAWNLPKRARAFTES